MFRFIKELFSNDDEVVEANLANSEVGWIINYKTESWIVDQVSDGEIDDHCEYKELAISTSDPSIPTCKRIEYRFGDSTIRVYEDLPIAETSKFFKIMSDVRSALKNDKPLVSLTNGDFVYYYNGKGHGVREDNEFLYWEYVTNSVDNYVRFEQWDENDFTCCVGVFEEQEAFDVLGGTT